MKTCEKGQMSLWKEEEIFGRIGIAERFLGKAGKTLHLATGMKPTTTISKANIFNSDGKRIWYGDIEIKRDKQALIELSERVGPLYVLHEMKDFFLEQKLPLGFMRSCAHAIVEDGNILYSKDFARRARILRGRAKTKRRQDRYKNLGGERIWT